MKKKKAVKKNWCPLKGHYTHLKYDNIIERARTLWSRPGVELRTPEGQKISSLSFTGEAIKKAQAIYDKWDELQRDSLNVERLQCYIELALNPETQDREGYLKDILFWFRDLNATELEVFSILAIYEARVSKNDVWPLELLALTEKYSPDATLGKQRRKQIKEWSSRGRGGRDREEGLKAEWLNIAKEYPFEKGYSLIATLIIKKLKLGENQHQTIRKWLSKNRALCW